MTIRVTPDAVSGIIKTDSSISISPFIRVANVLTDRIVANDSDGLLPVDLQYEIELWLAAHFYAIRDQQYSQKQTEKAGATFQGRTDMRLDATIWGQQAITLDLTGFLTSLSKGKTKVSLQWLGLPPSDQTDYEDRD